MDTGPTAEINEMLARESTYELNRTRYKWWVLLAVGLGTFMTALDGSVVNTILPILKQSFNSNIASIEWVVTTYLLILSSLMLSFGRLGDMRGHKSVYILGFIIFLISSASCGLAPSVNLLILFRSIQAFGGAMLAANSPAILTHCFPSEQRGQALGLQSTMTYLGLTVGPSLGGWIAYYFNWRVVFYINVPVALLAVILSMRFISPARTEKTAEGFDMYGAFLFMTGLIFLLFGLNQGHSLGWISFPILASLCISLILLASFFFVEKRSTYPMLDLQLFSKWRFSTSVVSAILNYICVYTILFLTPFYLIQARGYNTNQAGVLLTAMPIIMAIVAPLSGTISDRIGTRYPAGLGMAAMAAGLFFMSRLGADSSNLQIAYSLGITGFGTGTFISPNTSALMGAAPKNRQGIASGILATSRSFGMVLGVGLAGAILTTYMSHFVETQSAILMKGIHVTFLVTVGIAVLGTLVTIIHPDG
jgi:EmrB/QacA subfamily drug resistance transporter